MSQVRSPQRPSNTLKLTTLWTGTSLAQTSLYSNTLIGRQAMHLNVATLHLYLVSVICITHSGCELHAGPMSEYDCRSAANHCPQGFHVLRMTRAGTCASNKPFRQIFSASECGTNPCAVCTAGCSQSDTCEGHLDLCLRLLNIDRETEEDGAADEDAANEAEQSL